MRCSGGHLFLALAALLGAFALTSLAPTAAFAQDDETRNAALARTLFREGLALAEQERFEEAVERFYRAYRLKPTAAIAFNLAQSLVPLGRLVEAREQLRHVEQDPNAGRVTGAARELLASIEPKISELTIALEGPAEDVVVRMDGRVVPAEAVGIAIPADPGERHVEAVRDDAVVDSETIRLPEGGAGHVRLEVPARAPSPEEVAASSSRTDVLDGSDARVDDGEGDDLSWLVWVGVGAVVVGAAVAIIFVTASGPEAPVAGNASPGVVTWP
jgi:hypothetical protein